MVPLYNTCSSGVTVSNWSFLRAFTLFLTTTGRAEMSREGWNSCSSSSLCILSLSDIVDLCKTQKLKIELKMKIEIISNEAAFLCLCLDTHV